MAGGKKSRSSDPLCLVQSGGRTCVAKQAFSIPVRTGEWVDAQRALHAGRKEGAKRPFPTCARNQADLASEGNIPGYVATLF